MNFCKHRKLASNFRCVKCHKEIVLQFPHSVGGMARKYGNGRGVNPYARNSHQAFSWNCGWKDEGKK